MILFYCIFFLLTDYGFSLILVSFSHRGISFGFYALALLSYAFFALKKKNQKIHFYFLVGLFLRIFCLLQTPYTKDYLRYISDGLLLVEGKNPYQEKPVLDEVEYPEMRSMYFVGLWPYFFILAYLAKIFPLSVAAKILPATTELALSGFLAKKHKKYAWFYLTNPLSIFEIWHEAHFDIIPIALLVFAIYFLKKKRQKLFFVLASLSGSLKFYGFLFYPIFFGFSKKKFQENLLFNFGWLIFYLALSFSILPTIFFHATLKGQNSGLLNYFTFWHHGQVFVDIFLYFEIKQKTAVALLYFFFILCYFGAFFYGIFLKKNVAKFLSLFLLSFALFFPVQHPWYYLFFFAYIPFFKPMRNLFILLMVLVGWNYLTYTPFFEKSVWPPFFRLFLSFLLQKLFYHRIPSQS